MSLFHDIKETFLSVTHQAQAYAADQIKHPTFKNFYYWVLISFLLCFFMEVVLPKQREHGTISRKGFWLDILYIFFNDVIIAIIGFAGICAVFELLIMNLLGLFGIHSIRVCDITGWPVWSQILIMFILQDFMEFWAHWALHRSDLLWAFHKIHHAQEVLGAGSTRHFHWVEMFVFRSFIYIPFAMIGFSIMDYFLFQITVQNIWGFFTHSNIKVRWGFLNYIINTPETHAWHHAKNIPGRYGVNYASILNIWDLIFGFYYVPKDQKPVLGVPDQKDIPTTFLGQMIYPFKLVFTGKFKSQDSSQNIKKK